MLAAKCKALLNTCQTDVIKQFRYIYISTKNYAGYRRAYINTFNSSSEMSEEVPFTSDGGM